MTLKNSGVLSLTVALALVPGFVSAQTASSNYISVSSIPSGTSYAPGTTDATLGSVTLTATQPGSYVISSLPLSLSTTGSGTASDLSSCQLINGNGTALNTNANVLNTVSAGNNTVFFDTPLTVTNGAPVTLTERCNISSATPIGSTFSFIGGSPSFASSLTVAMTTFPSVAPGEMNAPLAAITLDPSASGSNLSITSLPLSVTYLNGLTSADLSNCRLTLSGSILNVNSTGILNPGANTLTLDSALPETAGAAATPILLNCTIASSAPVGSDVALSIDPSGVAMTNASNGEIVAATQATDPSTGAASSLGGTVAIGSPTTVTTTTTVTPPNTGSGASAPLTLALLLGSALLALLGISYLARSSRHSS